MISIRPRPPPIYILNLRDLLALSDSAVTIKPFQHYLVASSGRYHTQGRNAAGGEFVYSRRGFYSDSGNEQMGDGQGRKRSAISQACRIAPALRRAAFGFHYEFTLSTLERRITVSTMAGSYLRSTRRSPVDRRLRLVGQCGHRGSLVPMTGIAQVADVAGSDHSNNHFRQQRRSASTLSGISIAKNR